MKPHLVVVVVGLALLPGCTHMQLRWNFLHQAETAHAIQQQQVLDNLAMFIADPSAVPYFNAVGPGLTQVNDTGSLTASPSWVRSGFASIGSVFAASRVNQESFGTYPVTDPFKLSWMRCAYRAAVGAAVDPNEYAECCAIQQAWNKSGPAGCPGPLRQTCSPECATNYVGLPPPGWFGFGTKHDVPRCAEYVGRHGGTYVWVLPAGSEQLARLTITIIGFANTSRQTTWERAWNCCCDPLPVDGAQAKPPNAAGAPPENEGSGERNQDSSQLRRTGPSVTPSGLHDGRGAMESGRLTPAHYLEHPAMQTVPNSRDIHAQLCELAQKQRALERQLDRIIRSATGQGQIPPFCKITETTTMGSAAPPATARAGGGGGGGAAASPIGTAAPIFIPAVPGAGAAF